MTFIDFVMGWLNGRTNFMIMFDNSFHIFCYGALLYLLSKKRDKDNELIKKLLQIF